MRPAKPLSSTEHFKEHILCAKEVGQENRDSGALEGRDKITNENSIL